MPALPERCPVLWEGALGALGEPSYRLYNCERCGVQVRICSRCDHGNIYCAGECARIRRRESLRRAAARYQRSRRGAHRHAARQRRWRIRRRQEVTHQGCPGRAFTAAYRHQPTPKPEPTDAHRPIWLFAHEEPSPKSACARFVARRCRRGRGRDAGTGADRVDRRADAVRRMISRDLEAEILRLYHAEGWRIGTAGRQLHAASRHRAARAARRPASHRRSLHGPR